MSNGIYPNYVGPTVEYRYNSLYPSWVRAVAGIVLPPLEWLGGVLVLSQPYGIGMVASRISAIAQSAISAVTTVFSNRDTITTGEPGVEVEDEEPRI
jgi:hypothetical protein